MADEIWREIEELRGLLHEAIGHLRDVLDTNPRGDCLTENEEKALDWLAEFYTVHAPIAMDIRRQAEQVAERD